ncbi:MAG: hypothetical protein ACKPKO_49275, partial [Candidatus Fonsibacter sp.]
DRQLGAMIGNAWSMTVTQALLSTLLLACGITRELGAQVPDQFRPEPGLTSDRACRNTKVDFNADSGHNVAQCEQQP